MSLTGLLLLRSLIRVHQPPRRPLRQLLLLRPVIRVHQPTRRPLCQLRHQLIRQLRHQPRHQQNLIHQQNLPRTRRLNLRQLLPRLILRLHRLHARWERLATLVMMAPIAAPDFAVVVRGTAACVWQVRIQDPPQRILQNPLQPMLPLVAEHLQRLLPHPLKLAAAETASPQVIHAAEEAVVTAVLVLHRAERPRFAIKNKLLRATRLNTIHVHHSGKRSEEHTLNSSHITISYAVFCLKKKNTQTTQKQKKKKHKQQKKKTQKLPINLTIS